MQFCIQRLISEVESRPVLWDCRTKEYSERALKKEAWAEVCALFVPGYYESTDAEKKGMALTLQRKWKSARDAFLRELKKISGSGSGIKYSKQYAYYENLMFLKPIYELKEKEDDDRTLNHNDHVSVETEHNDDSENDSQSSVNFTEHKTTASSHETTPKRKRTEDKEDRIYNILEDHLKKKRKDVNNDPDRQFLLSLLPDLQSIDPSLKFDLKFEMMRVVKNYKMQSCKLVSKEGK